MASLTYANVDDKLHHALKLAALKANMTLRDYVLSTLAEKVGIEPDAGNRK